MNPGVLSVEIEHDAEYGTTMLFARAQCKKCDAEFEWSEKMIGGYATMEIIQDLFLDATKGECAKCRMRKYGNV